MEITKQQVFDAAWKGLKAQGFRDTGPSDYGPSARAYRRGELGCAVCHAETALGRGCVDYVGFDFVTFTDCHDLATSPGDMQRRLREFAKAEGLTVPGEPDAFQAFMAKVQEPVLPAYEVASYSIIANR